MMPHLLIKYPRKLSGFRTWLAASQTCFVASWLPWGLDGRSTHHTLLSHTYLSFVCWLTVKVHLKRLVQGMWCIGSLPSGTESRQVMYKAVVYCSVLLHLCVILIPKKSRSLISRIDFFKFDVFFFCHKSDVSCVAYKKCLVKSEASTWSQVGGVMQMKPWYHRAAYGILYIDLWDIKWETAYG